MPEERQWAWALLLAAPLCCGGLAITGAGGLAVFGAFAAWQGLLAIGIVAVIAALGILWWRRRRPCEP